MIERFYSLTAKYPLDTITYASSLLPIGVGISHFSYLAKEHKLIIWFFLSDFLVETIALILVLRGHSSWPMQDIIASTNIVFVALVYQQALIRRVQKRMAIALGLVFLIFSIYFYRGDIMSPWSQTAFRVYAMGLTLAYYNAILSDLNLRKIQHHSMFWFSVGLLFYASGTFFITLFNQYLYDQDTPDAIFDRYLNLMQFLYILFCLLASVGLWVSRYDGNNYFDRDYFKGNTG